MVPSSLACRDVHAPERLSSLSLDGTMGRNKGIDGPAVLVLVLPLPLLLSLVHVVRRRWKSLPMCRTVRSLWHLFGHGGVDENKGGEGKKVMEDDQIQNTS